MARSVLLNVDRVVAQVDVGQAPQDCTPFSDCVLLVGVFGQSFDHREFNTGPGCATYIVDLGLSDFVQRLLPPALPPDLHALRTEHSLAVTAWIGQSILDCEFVHQLVPPNIWRDTVGISATPLTFVARATWVNLKRHRERESRRRFTEALRVGSPAPEREAP